MKPIEQETDLGRFPENSAVAAETNGPPGPPGPPASSGPRDPRTASDRPGKRKGRGWVLALTCVVLLGGGGLAGAALVDPTGSDEYVALEASKKSLETELTEIEADYEVLQEDYDVMADGIRAREVDVEKRETAVATSEEKVKAAEATVKAREDAVTGAEKTKAANTVGDGTWVVGQDIAPGTYRASQPVGSSCYWGVYRSGSNGADILDNDIPGGGHPVVTLAEGQDFKSARCGTWEKQ